MGRFTATVPKMGAYVPDSGTPLAISHRIGVVRCPLAGRKGINGVSYTRSCKRGSLKSKGCNIIPLPVRLSRCHEWDARLLGAARLVTQHPPVRWLMATAVHLDKSGQHPTHHRASTHSSFSSSPAARQNHMEKGPNFTYGKDLHMVGAYNCLMVQTPANQRYLWLVPLRHHPERARDSSLPSRPLTEKRCSRPRVPASQQCFSSRVDGG